MMTASKMRFGNLLEFGNAFEDGRLTEESNGERFDYRKAIELMHKLGRPLTDQEAKEFKK